MVVLISGCVDWWLCWVYFMFNIINPAITNPIPIVCGVVNFSLKKKQDISVVNNTTRGHTKATEYEPLFISNTFQNVIIPIKPAIIDNANNSIYLELLFFIMFAIR